MSALIDTRIVNPFTAAAVRDQVAAILSLETINQQALATADSADPRLYEIQIYTERVDVITVLQDPPATQEDSPLLVNVWWEDAEFDPRRSDATSRQWSDDTINIDCYAAGLARPDGVGGQVLADQEAARRAQWVASLCYQILMSAQYQYLGLRGVVKSRFPKGLRFGPPQNSVGAQAICVGRLALGVGFDEKTPQITPDSLENLLVNFRRTSDGQVLADETIFVEDP